MYQTEESEQTENQLNHSKAIGIQSSERKLTQQTGRALLENKEETYQTIVFLPGLDLTDTLPNSAESIRLARGEPAITDTGQIDQWPVEQLDDSISFLDDLLAPIDLQAQSAHLGELNTPTIGESLVDASQRSSHHLMTLMSP